MKADLPSFEAQWWPVQLETVPGSGERLTVAVIVRGTNGQGTVRQAISPSTLHQLFGSAGKGMALLVMQTALSIQQQLEAKVEVEGLFMPFGNLVLGQWRDCVARDLNEVFDIAMRLSTAFSMSMFGSRTAETVDQEAGLAFDEWAEKVRLQTVATDIWRETLLHSFNVPVEVAKRKKLRFGFVLGGYVAQFGVLRPGRSVAADVRALKLKLFDIDILRRDQLLPVKRAEVLVGLQDASDTYTKRQVEAVNDSWGFIDQEAKARNIVAVRCNSAADAAQHLHHIAQAA